MTYVNDEPTQQERLAAVMRRNNQFAIMVQKQNEVALKKHEANGTTPYLTKGYAF